MNFSTRRVIIKILKEERMGESNLDKILHWYESWNDRLNDYVSEKNYTKIIDSHFKIGIGLLTSMKTVSNENPELKEKIDVLKNKLITINEIRKMIDNL